MFAGFEEKSRVPLGDASIVIQRRQTFAIYASFQTPNLRNSNGQEVCRVYSSTQYLAIHEGTSLSNLFGNPLIRPRVWNGMVKFTLEGGGINNQNRSKNGCKDNSSTTFDDNIGSFGKMIEIVTYNSSKHLRGFQFYTDKLEPVMYEIYTREGSYVNALFLSNWTLLGKGTMNGLGSGRGTPERNFSSLSIPKNVTQAFYVTLTTADNRYQDFLQHYLARFLEISPFKMRTVYHQHIRRACIYCVPRFLYSNNSCDHCPGIHQKWRL